MIIKVKDSKEKQQTYTILNRKCKNALENNDYEAIILYSYAMIEDRLLSMLHHLFVIDRYDKQLLPTDYIDGIIRPLLKYNSDSDKNRVYKMYNISTKIKIIKLFNFKNKDKNAYINDCYKMINKNINEKELNNYFIRLNKWIKIRNEVVHASFNKNIDSLKENIENIAKEGYELAKIISKYVNLIKDSNNQISVRTKWEGLYKVFNQIYKEEFIKEYSTDLDALFNYDILFPSFSEQIGDATEELNTLNNIISFNGLEFYENKNDLNIVIKDKVLKTISFYQDYLINLILCFENFDNCKSEKFDYYIQMDKQFKISNNNKLNEIFNQLTINYHGLQNIEALDNYKIFIRYIRDNYLNEIAAMDFQDLINKISENKMYLIGLSDQQINNIEIRKILEDIISSNTSESDFIEDYINYLLDNNYFYSLFRDLEDWGCSLNNELNIQSDIDDINEEDEKLPF